MNTYETADVGRVLETYEGTVVSSRPVNVAGQPGGLGPGTLAGGALGAGIGLQFGQGRGNDLATIVGGLIGAGAGYLAEMTAKSRPGIEYVVRTADGRVVTLVQNRGQGEEAIAPGTDVLIQYGSAYTRVIGKPRLDTATDDRWIDPDEAGSSGSLGASGSTDVTKADPLSPGGTPGSLPPGRPWPQRTWPSPGQQQ
ncbi:outer membrane lipoprotein [Arenibaculum pallidiluteum]|uniref:glycine zipper 2TM domain-containing protein n=1 Tax=Arenibaculum pallidiluteum TaxID=2812559 RepID=UPI001A965445|nr:glycine zipper 2TM domain-containing protein [Arenibaculum pallidiluteum]